MNAKQVLATARHQVGGDIALTYGGAAFLLFSVAVLIALNSHLSPEMSSEMVRGFAVVSMLGVILAFFLCLGGGYLIGRQSKHHVAAKIAKILAEQDSLRERYQRLAHETFETKKAAQEVLAQLL